MKVATTPSREGDPQDVASYLRGKAFMAGVRDDTPVGVACDVYLALEVEGAPKEALDRWRTRLDQHLMKTRPIDRDAWGVTPQQLAQMSKLMGSAQ